MGEESWDCWAPGWGLANQAPGVATFQVLQDKTNSINIKPGLQFSHRLMMISVCLHPGIISRDPDIKPGLQFSHRLMMISVCLHPGIISRDPVFEVSPTKLPWETFPIGNPDVLWLGTSQHCLSLDIGQKTTWWCSLCSFYFSFLLMLVYWK